MIAVVSLHVYPVKSLRGITLPALDVREDGPVGDRQFVVTDPTGKFLSQRQIPRMATVDVAFDGEELVLRAGERECRGPVPVEGDAAAVSVWRDEIQALSMGPAFDSFLTSVLGKPARLFHADSRHPRIRQSPRKVPYALHFADQAQVHVINLASVEALNATLAEKLPVDRFRANLVLEGAAAWAEESWKRIRVGSVEFEVMKHTARCKMITTDQASGKVGPADPLHVLKSQIKGEQSSADFGMHLRVLTPGKIRVGDEVEVLATKVVTPARGQ